MQARSRRDREPAPRPSRGVVNTHRRCPDRPGWLWGGELSETRVVGACGPWVGLTSRRPCFPSLLYFGVRKRGYEYCLIKPRPNSNVRTQYTSFSVTGNCVTTAITNTLGGTIWIDVAMRTEQRQNDTFLEPK